MRLSSGCHDNSWCGREVTKMSLAHWTTLSHVVGRKCFPTEMARFSRQLVPERASCSLSGEKERREGNRRGGKENEEGKREGEGEERERMEE